MLAGAAQKLSAIAKGWPIFQALPAAAPQLVDGACHRGGAYERTGHGPDGLVSLHGARACPQPICHISKLRCSSPQHHASVGLDTFRPTSGARTAGAVAFVEPRTHEDDAPQLASDTGAGQGAAYSTVVHVGADTHGGAAICAETRNAMRSTTLVNSRSADGACLQRDATGASALLDTQPSAALGPQRAGAPKFGHSQIHGWSHNLDAHAAVDTQPSCMDGVQQPRHMHAAAYHRTSMNPAAGQSRSQHRPQNPNWGSRERSQARGASGCSAAAKASQELSALLDMLHAVDRTDGVAALFGSLGLDPSSADVRFAFSLDRACERTCY